MSRWTGFKLGTLTVALLLALIAGLPLSPARAQDDPTPLRVEEATTGKITSDNPTLVYSFYAWESLRMAVVFDVIDGDMEPALIVLDQDQETILAGAAGPNANGVIVEFPAQGEYYLGVSGEESAGSYATFRLMIHAAPALPINPFVAQSFLVAGTSTDCLENTPVGRFSTSEDLNVCFALDVIDTPVEFEAQWIDPAGDMKNSEGGTLDSSFNGQLLLTGLVYPGEPWEPGWWQVHFLIDGELAEIQWVPVQ